MPYLGEPAASRWYLFPEGEIFVGEEACEGGCAEDGENSHGEDEVYEDGLDKGEVFESNENNEEKRD